MFTLTAPNHCIARIETKVGFGLTSLIVSFRPLAVTPEMWAVLPARNAAPPTRIWSSWSLTPTGEPIFGLRLRSNARWNDAAVTGEPSLNFWPGRIVKTYVLPSLDTVGKAVAPSGYSWPPSWPFFSG